MATKDLLKYEVKKYETFNTENDKQYDFPCFRLNKAVSYPLPEITFNQAVLLLDYIKKSFKENIGVNDYEVMYSYIQKFLNDNNIKLNVENVEHKYYSEVFDEFLADNYLNY